jgi:outer membrane protein insertion porin family
MRFSTLAILAVAAVLGGELNNGQQAIANPAPETSQLGGSIQLSNRSGLEVSEFEGARVRDVIIRFVNAQGNTFNEDGFPIENRVPEDVIRDELRLTPGEEFRETLVRADLEQLYRLRLFTNVTVSIEEVGSDVVVYYNVDEAPVVTYSLGGGINSDVGTYLDLGYINRGVGSPSQRFEAKLRPSGEGLEYDLRFVSPYSIGNNSVGYLLRAWRDRKVSEVIDQKIDLPNDDRAVDSRVGGNLVFSRPLGLWSGEFGLNYERISVRDEDGDLATEDARGNPTSWSGSGIDDLYTVSLGFNRSWFDNPFNATSGGKVSFTTEQSIPIGEGEISSNRLIGNYVQYVPIKFLSSDDPYALPEMLAFNLQAGTVIGDLPPSLAFALGGNKTVRGYEPGDLGTGRSYVLFRSEYRFSIWRDVGAVFFFDFASDLGSGDTIIGEPPEERDKPGTGFGGGVGLRVRTFLGLLRGDVGINGEGGVQVYFGTGQQF